VYLGVYFIVCLWLLCAESVSKVLKVCDVRVCGLPVVICMQVYYQNEKDSLYKLYRWWLLVYGYEQSSSVCVRCERICMTDAFIFVNFVGVG